VSQDASMDGKSAVVEMREVALLWLLMRTSTGVSWGVSFAESFAKRRYMSSCWLAPTIQGKLKYLL